MLNSKKSFIEQKKKIEIVIIKNLKRLDNTSSSAILNKVVLLFYDKIRRKNTFTTLLRFDFKKFKSEVRKMAYNKAKEEWKWRQWKAKEEEKLRACGMGGGFYSEITGK